MEPSASVFSILFQNIIGYDGLIFLLGAANAYLLFHTKRAADRLHAAMHRTLYVPAPQAERDEVLQSIRELREDDVVRMRRRANACYVMYANVTGVFPLLGILGTVLSLLPMVADMANVQTNFFAALTSTFWGLVFAIAFKLADGFVAPRMEENEKTVALYLERNQKLQEGP